MVEEEMNKKDKTDLKVITVYIIVFFTLLYLPVASAGTINQQVNITAVTVVNNSLETVRVEGVLFACGDNKCVAYVDVECPDCPVCPTVNTTTITKNITAEIADLKRWIVEHNSSDFELDDISLLVGEKVAEGVASIDENFKETYLPTKADFDNQTERIEELELENVELSGTISDLNIELTIVKSDKEETDRNSLLFVILLAILSIVMLVGILSREGGLGGFRHRILSPKGGYTPEEREIRKEKEKEEAAKKELALKKQLKKTEEATRKLKEFDIENIDTGVEMPVSDKEINIISNMGKPDNINIIPTTSRKSGTIPKRQRMEIMKEYICSKKGEFHINELKAWGSEKFGVSENTIQHDFYRIKSQIEKEHNGYFIGGQKEGWRFVKNPVAKNEPIKNEGDEEKWT